MENVITKDIVLLRITITKEKKDCYIGLSSNGYRYKLLKDENSKKLKVGDDRYHYAERIGSSLIYRNVLRLLSQEEEEELILSYQPPSLDELGITFNDI